MHISSDILYTVRWNWNTILTWENTYCEHNYNCNAYKGSCRILPQNGTVGACRLNTIRGSRSIEKKYFVTRVLAISVFLVLRVPAFLAATKQLYKWYFPSVRLSVCPSVRPSVRPSVCHTFLTMFPSSYHHEIFRSYYQ